MHRLKALLPLLLLVIAGVALFASGALDALSPQNLITQQDRLNALVAQSPWLARGAYLGMVTLSVATGIPGTIVLILAGGMLFGVFSGTVMSAIGLILGSLLLFLASSYAFSSGEREPPPLARRLRGGFLAHPLSYTLFLRLVPVFPFGATTIALAWLRCPLWMFLAASAFGGTVMLVFETAIGAGLAGSVARGQAIGVPMLMDLNILLPLSALAVLALVPVLLQHFRKLPSGMRRREQHDRYNGKPPGGD
ncbi:MAG TPA: VTT domain-containing protein [Gammaproteobacteria bacterium]|nr:VTT domain-containing protein [Gammaproteobacteria bacterium]